MLFSEFTPFNIEEYKEDLKDFYNKRNLEISNAFFKNYIDNIQNNNTSNISAFPSLPNNLKLPQTLISETPIKTSEVTSNNQSSYKAPVLKLKSQKEFIQTFKPLADNAEKIYGIDSKFILAQLALETGWGRSIQGNNPGNIKAYNWSGKKQSFNVPEYIKGQRQIKSEQFRVYNTLQEGFNDYVKLLSGSQRYKGIKGLDTENAINFISGSGYATDPNYATKLKQIVKNIK